MDKNNVYDEKTLQANFSALLYLLTEQQALIGKLMEALLENGLLSVTQLERITNTQGEEGLIPTYTELYKRFASYYLRTKQLLDTSGEEETALVDEDGFIKEFSKEKNDG